MDGTRTRDHCIKSAMLYRLSYHPEKSRRIIYTPWHSSPAEKQAFHKKGWAGKGDNIPLPPRFSKQRHKPQAPYPKLYSDTRRHPPRALAVGNYGETTMMKNILVLGVTGSIAAYKAAELTSRLRQEGVETHVIMTEAATRLVAPQTFLTLSKNPVTVSLWDAPTWKPRHIELALETKALLIAPATADILAKMANGIADDALSTFCLSHEGTVIVAPAMNPRMWRHPATRENCRILRERGVRFVGPVVGHVACGEEGEGRMAEVDDVFKAAMEAMKE